MKKLILMTFLFAFMVFTISSQTSGTDFRSKINIGIKAGINYSNLYDEQGDNFEADGKIGFVGGGFVAIPIGQFLGVQPEILYSQKGFKASGDVLGVPYTATHTSTFIDIPLLICIKPSEFITIMAGPQYSFLIKQKDSFSMEGFTTSEEEFYKNDNIRKNILCITGGFDINMQNLVFGARAGWDLQTNNGDGTSSNPRYKNAWYQATLGFRF